MFYCPNLFLIIPLNNPTTDRQTLFIQYMYMNMYTKKKATKNEHTEIGAKYLITKSKHQNSDGRQREK